MSAVAALFLLAAAAVGVRAEDAAQAQARAAPPLPLPLEIMNKVGAFIGGPPSPINATVWNTMSVMERVVASDWTRELLILLTIGVYVLTHVVGLKFNHRKVSSWVGTHRELLTSQFFQVGPDADSLKKAGASNNMELVVSDGPTAYSLYATGRENAATFLARIKVLGRQNLLGLAAELGAGFFIDGVAPREGIDIVIRPWQATDIPAFVFAVVNKANMREVRDELYYLSLTKTTDSDKLPVHFTFMTESAEITETMFSAKLSEAIKGSEKLLRFIAVTDQGDTAPKTAEELVARQRIVVSLNFPRNRAEEEASQRIVEAAIGLADVLAGLKPWRPEVAKKIKATREAAQKRVQKALDEKKAEELAEKRAASKRAAAESLPKLSASEQKKIEQKQREKEARKQRSKQTRRM